MLQFLIITKHNPIWSDFPWWWHIWPFTVAWSITYICRSWMAFNIVGMLTTKKRLKTGFAFGISITSRRLPFPDPNSLNFLKIFVSPYYFCPKIGEKCLFCACESKTTKISACKSEILGFSLIPDIHAKNVILEPL